jgi:S1-C subfamily serine protease
MSSPMLTRYGNLSGEQPAHGQVIGGGEKTDIALVKIDTNQKLPYVTWGNSDDAKVGVGGSQSATRSLSAAR